MLQPALAPAPRNGTLIAASTVDRVKATLRSALQAVELLRHQFTEQRRSDSRIRTGPGWRRGRPMFTYIDGRPIRPEYLTHRFREICRELGLPPIRRHDLRHCAATLAQRRGMRELTLMTRLGHATPDSMKVYTRVSDPEVVKDYRRATGGGTP